MDVSEVLDDLVAEQHVLDRVVADLTDEQFATPTPSPRWTVTDQLGHLTFFDTSAALAIEDPEAFAEHRAELLSSFDDDLAVDEATLGRFREREPAAQLLTWRSARLDLEAAARQLTNDSRIEWYGPSMGSKSFLTARLMEVWAHGQDICDALGVEREPTDRIRHIAQLGVITRGWSYVVRGEQPAEGDVRVSLTAPSGEPWVWGPEDAPDEITGPASDFCLVVTQRRHVADTALTVDGDLAAEWMWKAQAFAGTPTTGPAPKGTG
jgi:uncharacterized protein (TIGR03084 family)